MFNRKRKETPQKVVLPYTIGVNPLPDDVHFISLKPAGAWIVYSYDTNALPVFLSNDELTARRRCDELGYGYVKFWEFETDWSNT